MAFPTQEEFVRAQTKRNPKEDLRPYQGRWVALRDGKVIASDLSLAALRSQPEVNRKDVVMPVSRHQGRYFIA